jgi:hypothetical protein
MQFYYWYQDAYAYAAAGGEQRSAGCPLQAQELFATETTTQAIYSHDLSEPNSVIMMHTHIVYAQPRVVGY